LDDRSSNAFHCCSCCTKCAIHRLQGLVSYFYGEIQPNTSLELNRCEYNQMVDSPYGSSKETENQCLTGESQCEDCRLATLDRIYTAHYTLCMKPWWCPNFKTKSGEWLGENSRLCSEIHREWHRVRRDFEDRILQRSTKQAATQGSRTDFDSSEFQALNSFGICRQAYQSLVLPEDFKPIQ
jgi:hypothetical protein